MCVSPMKESEPQRRKGAKDNNKFLTWRLCVFAVQLLSRGRRLQEIARVINQAAREGA